MSAETAAAIPCDDKFHYDCIKDWIDVSIFKITLKVELSNSWNDGVIYV